jgi:hypothetical protein
MATADGSTGDWWYWFSWAERIGSVQAPIAAADAIIRAFWRPVDGPEAPQEPVADGHASSRELPGDRA